MFATLWKLALTVSVAVVLLGDGRLLWCQQPAPQKPEPSSSLAKSPAGPAKRDPPNADEEHKQVKGPKTARELRQFLNQPPPPTHYLAKAGLDDPKLVLGELVDLLSKSLDLKFRIDSPAFMHRRVESWQAVCNLEVGEMRPAPGIPLGTILHEVLGRLQPVPLTYLVQSNAIVLVPLDAAEDATWLFGQRVKLEIENRTFQAALEDLSDLTGVSIIVDPRLGEKAKTPVAGNFQNLALETAVRLLADMADVKVVPVNTALYVTAKTNTNLTLSARRNVTAKFPAPFANGEVEGVAGSLDRVARMSGLPVVLHFINTSDYKGTPGSGLKIIEASLHNVPPDKAIKLLADMAGLKTVEVDGVFYVTAKENAEAFAKEMQAKKAPTSSTAQL